MGDGFLCIKIWKLVKFNAYCTVVTSELCLPGNVSECLKLLSEIINAENVDEISGAFTMFRQIRFLDLKLEKIP